jgi:uridine phosphorylase
MLVPTAPVAKRAILPDDPGVALKLAGTLLAEDRLMANHHRGLWGYSGSGADGSGPLSIQSTGVGAGSATLVLSELIALGVAAAIRVGACRSHRLDLTPGSLVAVDTARTARGEALALDPALTDGLGGLVAATLPVSTWEPEAEYGGEGIWDLETAALAELAARTGVRFGALLVVSGADGRALEHDELAEATAEAGRTAAVALAN